MSQRKSRGLRPEDRLVAETGEDGFERVDGDPLCPDLVDHRAEPDEEPFEIVLAGLFDLGAFDRDMVEDQFLLLDKLVEIEPHRLEVLLQVVDLLLERDEDTGLVVLGDPPGDELHRKEGLPAPRAAADERGPAFRQAPTGYVVEAFNPGGDFFKLEFSCARRLGFPVGFVQCISRRCSVRINPGII